MVVAGYREKVITPEMLEEKAKKLQKRKQLADEKRENDKVSILQDISMHEYPGS